MTTPGGGKHARATLLQVLPQHPAGVTMREVAELCGVSVWVALSITRRMVVAGELVADYVVGGLPFRIVCLPHQAEAMRERCIAKAAERQAAYVEKQRHSKGEQPPEFAPIQRVVPAHKVPRLVKAGPASVWELAL